MKELKANSKHSKLKAQKKLQGTEPKLQRGKIIAGMVNGNLESVLELGAWFVEFLLSLELGAFLRSFAKATDRRRIHND